MYVRALHLVAIEFLRRFIDDVKNCTEFDLFLKRASEGSVLAEHWLKNLVRPNLLMLLYLGAKREREFSLHLYNC